MIGQIIGADNYDIGHIGLGINGGGVAGLGVVGGSGKADGCTGLPFPEGDFYAIDYVAHEIGHQMGGNHTFNGTQGNCRRGNRNVDTTLGRAGLRLLGHGVRRHLRAGQPAAAQRPLLLLRSIEEITATVADDPSDRSTSSRSVNLAGFDGTGRVHDHLRGLRHVGADRPGASTTPRVQRRQRRLERPPGRR